VHGDTPFPFSADPAVSRPLQNPAN
jgi:hypothetical protein